MHSRQTRSAASSTSAPSHASTRSERYAKRQVATSMNNVVDDIEANIPDTTLRGSQPRPIRSPGEALVHQGEIREGSSREGLRRFQELRAERESKPQNSSIHHRRRGTVETSQRMESRELELAYNEGILGEKSSSLSERKGKSSPLSERGESTSLSEGRASGQRSRRITHHRAETRQSTESDE